jgi:hypothetical protein
MMPNHEAQEQPERGMRTRDEDQSVESGAGGGGWRGWVVPYRYAGPGYAGWGYYSVMYHGPSADSSLEGDEGAGRAASEGQDPRMTSGGRGYGGDGGFRDAEEGGTGRGRFEQGGFGESGFEQGGLGPQGGRFAGVGPQRQRRSDDRLREEVCDRLTDHGWIDASDIEVDVKDGEVTLRGSVPERRMKRMAADLVDDIRGVQDVMNELKVRREDESGRGSEQARSERQESGQQARGGGQRSGMAQVDEAAESARSGKARSGRGGATPGQRAGSRARSGTARQRDEGGEGRDRG